MAGHCCRIHSNQTSASIVISWLYVCYWHTWLETWKSTKKKDESPHNRKDANRGIQQTERTTTKNHPITTFACQLMWHSNFCINMEMCWAAVRLFVARIERDWKSDDIWATCTRHHSTTYVSNGVHVERKPYTKPLFNSFHLALHSQMSHLNGALSAGCIALYCTAHNNEHRYSPASSFSARSWKTCKM